MDRRTALKNLTAGIGYAVATPAILNILSSCTAKTETWIPLFLSEDEKHMVTHLVDIMLPKTELPGALDVNIPQFIDLMFLDIESESNKKQFKKGAELFSKKTIQDLNKPISDVKKEDFSVILNSYFDLSEAESKKIINQQKLNVKNVPENEAETYHIYKFLLTVRYYAIFGYCTSEEIGESVLAYDPVPGVYQGCISLEETTNGRAWSL
ncbi:gluconate 2-dehydrogenase subunit 3 family protein [Seonamhaeicola sp.]|uniref:gluconate 2-dehydrogenase subunit 3 family protein n=1 Tax=Seonamhaeicola sp. TaxID=1912245 RepID=UPI0026120534|nr:gluconate 2-dehydrogenase subunit 3 family protein [Seonamhaeicola sp.]